MSEILDRVVGNKEAAHEAARVAYAHAQAIILNGKQAHILCEEHEDDRTIQQNRFYWGPCLGEISEQAKVEGVRYTDEAWHEFFKRMFLGYEIKKVRVAGRKRPTTYRRLRSTRNLKVKPFGIYLDKVQAYATSELGVMFSVLSWKEYRG